MAIEPLVQPSVIDVAQWEVDAEFGVFPQGARAKDAVIAPRAGPVPILVPGKRYLFKRSKKSYPDQFWGEVIAYRVGCLLDLQVPPAFAAFNSQTGHCGALIEWFYEDGKQLFVWAGEFLQKLFAEFDREKGTRHNIVDNAALMRALSFDEKIRFETDWRQWWVNALLFDSLIGNTDRHQDNWGFIFSNRGDHTGCALAPLFDNGTSLGHELFVQLVEDWKEDRVARYVARGTHHVMWSLKDEAPIRQHLGLLHRALTEWPQTRVSVERRIDVSHEQLDKVVADLASLDSPVPLSSGRLTLVLRLLKFRLDQIKAALL